MLSVYISLCTSIARTTFSSMHFPSELTRFGVSPCKPLQINSSGLQLCWDQPLVMIDVVSIFFLCYHLSFPTKKYFFI